jgi:ferric-dicitrate binding protein FerR (iron transport regulator)
VSDENQDPIAQLIRLAGPRPRASEERMARMRVQVHEEWLRSVKQRRRVRRFSVAVVAAAVIVAVLLIIPREASDPVAPPAMVAKVQAARGITSPVLAPAAEVAEGTWIETRAGSAMSLDWNGATLRLGEDTRLRLDSAQRATLGRGALYFDGQGTSVVIHTPLGDIRDMGTQFEVRLGEETLRVRVREGRVDLRGAVAEAGTELFADRTSLRKGPIAVSGAEWQWIEHAAPPLVLEGLTLREALTRIAREKGLRLELRGVDADVRLHGSMAFTPEEALDAATAATSLSHRIENDTLIVSRRQR